MTYAETFVHAGLTVKIGYDHDSDNNPRDNDCNNGIMLCAHSRYTLGDEQVNDISRHDRFTGWRMIARYLGVIRQARCIIPLGLIDHSGISMYVGGGAHAQDPGGWDSGTVGLIYTTNEQLRKGGHEDPAAISDDTLREWLTGEVKEYNSFLTGEVYYYKIVDSDGEVLDSRYGFVGDIDYCISEAKSAAESESADIAVAAAQEARNAAWAASYGIPTLA